MTSEKDIIWVWDTEYDKKQAEQLEKRVKQKIIEEIEKIFDNDEEQICKYISALQKGNAFKQKDKKEVIAWLVKIMQIKDKILKSLGEKNNAN